ncbi:MAG: PTS sugar transporter subunit IIA, partial [Alphaproteobacteria bacterium]|nr:PTS sugar transporter subunit IIA [Alphaproteobacteria bacterium]
GVGRGIAIPHAKMAGLEGIHGFLIRSREAVPFEAVDDEPVDLFFLLLAPESAGAEHLKALARVSRALRDRDTVKALREAAGAAAMRAVLEDR